MFVGVWIVELLILRFVDAWIFEFVQQRRFVGAC